MRGQVQMVMKNVALATLVAAFMLVCWNAGAQPPVVPGAKNIAAAANGGRIVAVSSEALDKNGRVIPQWAAKNLIDGKHVVGTFVPADSYGWSSNRAPTADKPEWVIIAFAGEQTHLIGRMVIDPTTADPPIIGRWVRHIELQVSNTTVDGPYKTVGHFTVVNRPIKQTFDFPPVEARYVRLVIWSNHGSDKCVEMGEVEIYEAIVGDDVLDQLIMRLENLLQDLKRYRDGLLYRQQRERTEQQTRKEAPPEAAQQQGSGQKQAGGQQAGQGQQSGQQQRPAQGQQSQQK